MPEIDLTGAFIGLCFLVFVGFWSVTAFSTKRTVRSRGWWRASLLLFALYMAVRFGVLRGPTWNGRLWPRSLAVSLFADVLALAGTMLLVWARTVLGRNWSAGVVLKQDHDLVTSGPYAWVRHPIYSGLLLLALGWATWRATAAGFVGFVALLAFFWIKSRAEEGLMIEQFGDAYRDYRARVKALVPYVL